MSTISKFIVNRNDLNYIYVEKRLISDNPIYYVYCNAKSYILPPEHFQNIYATDKKMSIGDFLIQVQTDVIGLTGADDFALIYATSNKILKEISGKNKKNPSLGNFTYSLCNLLDKYNEFVYEESKRKASNPCFADPLDYEAEYCRLIKQEL